MYDALHELSELSLNLQERNIDLKKSHNESDCLDVFQKQKQKSVPGVHFKKTLDEVENLQFKFVTLLKKNTIYEPSISPDAFYEQI
jgi:hypothetical protein